jgi:hypothetical protein
MSTFTSPPNWDALSYDPYQGSPHPGFHAGEHIMVRSRNT